MAAYVARQEGRQATVTLAGELTATIVPDLQNELRAMLDRGTRVLIFDLSNTAILDSIGMSLLIAAANSLAAEKGTVRVTNVHPDIFRLLQSMRLAARLNVSPRA